MALLSRILSRPNLLQAYQQVVSNGGSSGVDQMKVTDLAIHLQQQWSRIKSEVTTGKYKPQAIRGVEIPKPNGGIRLLGIPTVTDRFIQQAIHQILSPIWDKDFSTYSYGFRPNRNAHQALRQAQSYINQGYQYILDLDLANFFDEISHDILVRLLNRKVKDKRLLKLIRCYLQAGILREGFAKPRSKGTPQGSPLSPLLSNILLNELDQELGRRGLRFVRYADDCSIFLRSRRAAYRVKKSITRFLEKQLRLKVNEQKTSICRPIHFELLGYGFVSTYRKGERGKYNLRVSPKSFKRLKLKIKVLTRKTSPIPFSERIRQLNALVRGWVNYFKLAHTWQKLKTLDTWVRNRLRYCIWKMWKKPDRRRRAFIQLGIPADQAYAWSRSRMGGWAIACSPIMKTTVTLDRLKLRGYLSFTDYYVKCVHGS